MLLHIASFYTICSMPNPTFWQRNIAVVRGHIGVEMVTLHSQSSIFTKSCLKVPFTMMVGAKPMEGCNFKRGKSPQKTSLAGWHFGWWKTGNWLWWPLFNTLQDDYNSAGIKFGEDFCTMLKHFECMKVRLILWNTLKVSFDPSWLSAFTSGWCLHISRSTYT